MKDLDRPLTDDEAYALETWLVHLTKEIEHPPKDREAKARSRKLRLAITAMFYTAAINAGDRTPVERTAHLMSLKGVANPHKLAARA